MQYVLADTGVWYAMFDQRDPYHQHALQKAAKFDALRVVMPWPVMYETLRTRLVRNYIALVRLDKFLRGPNIVYLDDAPLRETAMELAFESSLQRKRPLSMVDCLIRLLLEDINTRISYLATFNVGDFSDVCRIKGVEII
jgi:predicted nucleic acid-binding protein